MILTGDIGGTKTALALIGERDGKLTVSARAAFPSRGYSGLKPIIRKFLDEQKAPPSRACFGVAGRVEDGAAQLTNLPWRLEAAELKKALGLDSVRLINDLAALAASVPFLADTDVEVLQEGGKKDPAGRFGVIAAGTGLGQAYLIPSASGGFRILDSEAGHGDFPAHSSLAVELHRFLLEKYDRVSVEHVLSGTGLFHTYLFINRYNSLSEPEWLTAELEHHDPAGVIAACALQKKSPACEAALDLFVSVYGAQAGNMALQLLTRGGVFVGGGIGPRIADRMKNGPFMGAFSDKGPFRSFMSEIPVRLIVNADAPLLGAAQVALGKVVDERQGPFLST